MKNLFCDNKSIIPEVRCVTVFACISLLSVSLHKTMVIYRPEASKIYSAEKIQRGLMILLCWYRTKDQDFLLLLGHIL